MSTFVGEGVKVISLIQPWASLIVLGEKRCETRGWSSRYTGPLAIHASAKTPYGYLAQEEPYRSVLERRGLLDPKDWPLGALLGVVDMTGCRPTLLAEITEQERAFGDYGPGRYYFQLERPVMLAQPIPQKGALGIWEVRNPAKIRALREVIHAAS